MSAQLRTIAVLGSTDSDEGFANRQGLRAFLRAELGCDGAPSDLLLAVMAWIWFRARAARPLTRNDMDMLEVDLGVDRAGLIALLSKFEWLFDSDLPSAELSE